MKLIFSKESGNSDMVLEHVLKEIQALGVSVIDRCIVTADNTISMECVKSLTKKQIDTLAQKLEGFNIIVN